MGSPFLSPFWGFLGESVFSLGCYYELERIFGRQETEKGLVSKTTLFILDCVETRLFSNMRHFL